MSREADAAQLLSQLDQSLKAALAPLGQLQKLLRAAVKSAPDLSLAQLRKLESGLGSRDALLQGIGVTDAAAVLEAVRGAISERVQSRRLSFARDLREACRHVQVEPRRVTEDPEEWRLGPLTLLVDYDQDAGQLRYARLPVVEDSPLVGERLVHDWSRARAALEKASVPPDRFLDALDGAYRSLLATLRKPLGERVPLVDLLPSVALAIQSERFRRSPSRATFRDYPRPQFSYDLARLRRERRLLHKGLRVDLGTAVGNATADKKQVLWIEDDSGSGQYYLFFRFLPQKETEQPEMRAQEARNDQPGSE